MNRALEVYFILKQIDMHTYRVQMLIVSIYIKPLSAHLSCIKILNSTHHNNAVFTEMNLLLFSNLVRVKNLQYGKLEKSTDV